MGQYYYPILATEDKKYKTFNSWDYGNGCKLMEHSYVGNNFIAAILHELTQSAHRVWWLGDYSEIEDFENKDEDHSLPSVEGSIYNYFSSNDLNIPATEENQVWNYKNAYIVNYDKKCFIKIPPRMEGCFVICPLSLLTAVGNGRGGGDYHSGTCMEDVGTWSGDLLQVWYELPEDVKSSFQDLTAAIVFEED